ncbi:serine protease inhibitor 34 isoform X1 [Bombyx mori]|uniref:Serpin domain-containing protein n=1 Tax=Bombyx mori TaxID=7091 RepID=A0A8R2C9S9_BOMMO|nr:serine protease inhibitor 34 isoform X1 [Bombyx mori]
MIRGLWSAKRKALRQITTVDTMRRSGRALSCAAAGLFCNLLYACIKLTESTDYGVPIEIKLWDTGRTPLAHMVDVTNEFGLKVLAEHNFLNENNIAFSPYGLMGILVALYEGVDGESSYQLQRAIQLPWNRKIMRVGFRDIHRTLKTYFVPEEGFLAGLALNNENVTFNENFKKILRFYGFDLDNDQLPALPNQTNKTMNETTPKSSTIATSQADGGDVSTGTTVTTENTREETTPATSRDTTANPNAETINTIATTTAIPSSAPNFESTTVGISTTTLQDIIKPLISSTETTTQIVTTTNSVTTSTNPTDSTTNENLSITTANPSSTDIDEETIAQQTSQATVALTQTENNEIDGTAAVTSSTVDLNFTESTTSVSTTEIQTDSVTFTTSTDKPLVTLSDTATSSDMTTAANGSSLETLERRKKSIVDFIFTNPPYVDDYLMYRSFDIPAEPPKPTFDEQMFLANGLKSVQVTYMHYDTILEHAYLPHLEASALRLPLDSERYYLLVVLPARGSAAELGRLLARMARESDLSDIYAALRPRRVKGIVPSFTVKGHVTLTTDLQKLGIRDVFEPRQRDFTLMTRQSGVYVRNIEQAVSVAIRKYRPDDQKKNRYVTNHEPVHFFATYPFLYFVMDASIHVSLMSGKMVDPLNSRIL